MTVDTGLGSRIRTMRQARRLTLRALASRAGVTESFLSQVERDVTNPSIASVQRIARGLDLSIAQLFADEPSTGRVVRRAERRRAELPAIRTVTEYLTSNLAGRLQVVVETIEPGGGSGEAPFTHDSDEEVFVVLEGAVDVWIADERHVLAAGDAISLPPRSPHWHMNRGDVPAVVLVCLTPPSL